MWEMMMMNHKIKAQFITKTGNNKVYTYDGEQWTWFENNKMYEITPQYFDFVNKQQKQVMFIKDQVENK